MHSYDPSSTAFSLPFLDGGGGWASSRLGELAMPAALVKEASLRVFLGGLDG